MGNRDRRGREPKKPKKAKEQRGQRITVGTRSAQAGADADAETS